MIKALSSSGNSSKVRGSGTLAKTCKPIQNPSGVTLVKIELLRLRDGDLVDLDPIAVEPPTLKAFQKSNTVSLLLLLRPQFYDKGLFLKATVPATYGNFLVKGWVMTDAQTLMIAEEMTTQASYSRLFRSSVMFSEKLKDDYVPPATRCTLTALLHLFRTTLRRKLDEAVIEWLLKP
jgi:hypothetical protein